MNIAAKKTISLRVSPNFYDYLKNLANKENRSLTNFLETTLLEVSDYKEPNETTLQAMQEVQELRKNKNKKSFSDIKELMNFLND